MELKMRVHKTIVSAQSLGLFDVSDESKVRFVIENAGPLNQVVVRGKLAGQASFTELKIITGATIEVVNVFTYEVMEIECTIYDSTGNDITIIAASFSQAGGSAIEAIGVPSGDTLTDISTLTLTSSDNSVGIVGDNLAKSIDLTVSGSAASYVPAVPADWSPAPTTVGEGLDQLADRTTTIESILPNKIDSSEKGAPSGVAPLNASSKIDSTYLPSYVDDVVEYANLAAFPLVGETSKIYVALDTNLIYRWSGSGYVQISESAVLSVNSKVGTVVLDKTDIGLSNVDNTSDLNKPVSTATQNAINALSDSFKYGQVVYVDKSNTNVYTADGSLNKPYKSIEAMYTAITDASASKRYACIIAPGTYTEAATVQMKGWIDLIAFATDTVIISVTGGATFKWSNNYPGRAFIKDIGFSVGIEVLNDNPSGTSGVVLDLDNVDANSLMFRGRGGGRDYIQLRNDTRISSTCTIQSAATTVFDSTNISSLIMNDIGCVAPDSYGSAITASFRSNYIGSMQITATTYDIYTDIWGTIIAGNLSITSNSPSYPCYFNYDATSYPLGTVTLSGSNPAQLVRTSVSQAIKYTPAVSGNWTAPVPAEVKAALDNLAANKISISQKGAANGVAPLDATSKIDASYLPTYVDDVLEYANLAAFPLTGESGKIYVAIDTGKIYRWSGVTYTELSATSATTWGSITGTLSSQTDLQNALDGKANTSHTQALSTITQSGATTGQVPIWNGTAWAPGVPAGTSTWGGISGTLSNQTDLQLALDGKFDDPTGTVAQYIRGDGTLATFPTSINQANSLVTTVFNKTGVTIPKFSVVYINGGQGDLPTITLAQANSENTSSKTYGVVYADILNMQSGQVIVNGALTGLNTDQFNPTAPVGDVNGTALYLSPTVAGAVTTTKPSAPDHMVYVATIVRTHQTQGVVEVRIQNGFELNELHNVQIPNGSAQNNQVLKYDFATSLWKNNYIGLASDIEETSFSVANNQSSVANIIGLAFSNATVRSFKAIISVKIDADIDLFEIFEISGIQKSSDWFISINSEGDNSEVILSITSTGQMQYTTPNYTGFSSGVLKFRAITTSV